MSDGIKKSDISSHLLLHSVANVANRQAGDIVEQLKAGIAMKAIIVRNNKEVEIEARDIVPGDIVSKGNILSLSFPTVYY